MNILKKTWLKNTSDHPSHWRQSQFSLSKRKIVDYWRLNTITIKNHYLLPLIQILVDQLAKAQVFSKLDLWWGYNNICIKERDQWKTVFKTPQGLYEPMVMNFELTNAPTIFQHMMDDIFKDLEGVYIIIYLDDILIFSSDYQSHTKHIWEILQQL